MSTKREHTGLDYFLLVLAVAAVLYGPIACRAILKLPPPVAANEKVNH